MRTRTTNALLGFVATGLAAIVAPAANATTGGDTIHGGCGFNTQQVPPLSDQNSGVIFDLSATEDASGLPTGATVSCTIEVNGVIAPGTTSSFRGWGVQAGTNEVSYTATGTDMVNLCERVVYADGTDTGLTCFPDACTCDLPPQALIDVLNFVFGVLNTQLNGIEVWDIDPRVCPVLAANAGTYDPVTIRSDGDVYVTPDPTGVLFDPALLSPFWDCPPYGNF